MIILFFHLSNPSYKKQIVFVRILMSSTAYSLNLLIIMYLSKFLSLSFIATEWVNN